jgi:CRISPR-associated protein Cas5 subtype I-B
MRGILFDIKGNWAHYRKPETNNNPLTHDFITKTALLGLMGAVLGTERKEMAQLFPQLSEDLLYGVCVKTAVKKESWAFTLRYVVDFFQKAPKQMEFLKNPENRIALALKGERSAVQFDSFQQALKTQEARFTPVLGLHNCPAELSFVAAGEFRERNGEFVTQSFVKDYQLDASKLVSALNTSKGFRLGVERVPTFQDDDFWNPPEKYVRVVYPSEGKEVFANGEYFQFTNESQWTLI